MYNLFFIFLILIILCNFKIIITANGTIMENNDILQQEETFQIVRSIRATITTPRLKTTEHIFAANTDYNIAVSIRKAFLNVNITLLNGVFHTVHMPIRIDNTEYIVKLRLKKQEDDVTIQKNVDKLNFNTLTNFCNKVGVWDETTRQKLIRNAQIFLNSVIEQIVVTTANTFYNVCLNVQKIQKYSQVVTNAEQCEIKSWKSETKHHFNALYGSSHRITVEYDRLNFSLVLAKHGTYDFAAFLKPSTLTSFFNNNIIYINSNVHNIITTIENNHLSTSNSCSSANYIDVVQPKMLSIAKPIMQGGHKWLEITATCKKAISKRTEILFDGYACVKTNKAYVDTQIVCKSCNEIDLHTNNLKIYFPLQDFIDTIENNNEEEILPYMQMSFWWSFQKIAYQNNTDFDNKCISLETRRQIQINLRDDIVKNVANAINITIVTGATSSYFGQLKNLIGSIHVWEPTLDIYIYDLGLNSEELAKISKWKRCFLRSLKNSKQKIPDHVFDLSSYAFKVFMIQDMFFEFEIILYIDAGNVLLRPLDLIRESLVHHGYFLMPQTSNAFPWPKKQFHHPNTLALVGCTNEKKEKLSKGKLMTACVAPIQGWIRDGWMKQLIFESILKCNSIKSCITPVGSDRTNHLQDQTVLNAVLCSKGLDICSANNITYFDNLWLSNRIMVHPTSILKPDYWKYIFRRYDNTAMDFYDAGVEYKKVTT